MSDQIIISTFSSPFGDLILGSYNNDICLCDWINRKARTTIDARIRKGLNTDMKVGLSPIIETAKKQLNEYFYEERTSFTIPLITIGSDFQKLVWKELHNIPFGKTLSYYQLAEKIGDIKAIRAVAAANGANAISIFLPCHRIIGSSGELTGYAGGLYAKRKLLELESKNIQIELFES